MKFKELFESTKKEYKNFFRNSDFVNLVIELDKYGINHYDHKGGFEIDVGKIDINPKKDIDIDKKTNEIIIKGNKIKNLGKLDRDYNNYINTQKFGVKFKTKVWYTDKFTIWIEEYSGFKVISGGRGQTDRG